MQSAQFSTYWAFRVSTLKASQATQRSAQYLVHEEVKKLSKTIVYTSGEGFDM